MNFLSNDERIQLKVQHKQERDKQVCDRIKAVLLSEDAIRDHIAEYKSSQKPKPENGGSAEKLTSKQSGELEKHLQAHIYLYIKDINAYVQAKWSVVYSVPGMRNWLKRHGFCYKKPALVPGKANEQQQREWIAEYEKLKQNLPQDETLCFMDGVHPTHNVQSAYGWIKKGERKDLENKAALSASI